MLLQQVIEGLGKHDITIIEGPCTKTGAMGDIRSVYFRDPDLNLVEVSEYL
jgi:catechol 2,3-dioxygenase-like lactoylglutathione lyase family enzyme